MLVLHPATTPMKLIASSINTARYNWKPVVASFLLHMQERGFTCAFVNNGDEDEKVKTIHEAIEHAIQDTMQQACTCEHDCCGHVRSYVSRVRRLKSGLYAVIENHYRNV